MSSNRSPALRSCRSFPFSPAASSPDLGSTVVWISAEQSPNLAQNAGVQILSSNPVPKLTVESKLILFALLWFCRD